MYQRMLKVNRVTLIRRRAKKSLEEMLEKEAGWFEVVLSYNRQIKFFA